jgi:lysophospholipid acyltransferase (LPLAT)-like uncharacterized protein
LRDNGATLNPVAENTDAVAEVVYELTGWRRLAGWLLGVVASLWGRSLRFELTAEDLRNITKNDEPLSIVAWHNRLFIAVEIVRRYRRRPIYALVSASQDGAWLAAFLSAIGMHCVRGSSSHLGREAVAALVEKLRAGYDIGVTPDGPRGPMYDFKGGAYIVTRRAGAPAILLGGRFTKARRLKSWDGFYVPMPFSRVQILCRQVSAAELRAPNMTVAALRERLMAINPDHTAAPATPGGPSAPQKEGTTAMLPPGSTT